MSQTPFVDLHTQYKNLKKEIDTAIQGVLDSCAFVGVGGNPYVQAFESEFAACLGVNDFIACGNGTDAIEILLRAAGIGPGDEVIVPALTWISTAEAVSAAGATPVFADIEPEGFAIDPNAAAAAVTERTRAIIPVHLYGQMAEMDSVLGLAKRWNLFVLEDCAQAHGATYKGSTAGTLGDAGSFSFFPGKNLGAYGDAGGMTARDPNVSRRARLIANHGQTKKHQHEYEGRNSRMDGIQAAVLSVKLKYLDDWTERRREAARIYRAGLGEMAPVLDIPPELPERRHVYHLFVIGNQRRDDLMAHLRAGGISCGIHYPSPLPYLETYRRHGRRTGAFPVAEKASRRILSLPIYPEISKKQIENIVSEIKTFFAGKSA